MHILAMMAGGGRYKKKIHPMATLVPVLFFSPPIRVVLGPICTFSC